MACRAPRGGPETIAIFECAVAPATSGRLCPYRAQSTRSSRSKRRSGRGEMLLRGALERSEARAQQARHVHLAHADPLGDLALAQPSVEAQLDDRALALGQRREQLADHQPVVRAREQLIVDTQREALAVSAVVVVRRRDEWGGPIRTARFECFEDVVDPDAEMLGELVGGRRPALLAGKEVDRV